MGAGTSRLSKDDINQLTKKTSFSSAQIVKLFKRYKELDKKKEGYIHCDQLLDMPELSVNPLRRRIVNMVDEDKTGQISFKAFMKGMAPMCENAPPEEKLDFAFRIYDVNGDNVIDHSDLRIIIKLLVGNNMSEQYVTQLVETAMKDADKDGNMEITFEEFCSSIATSISVEKILTIVV